MTTLEHPRPLKLENYIRIVALTSDAQRVSYYSTMEFFYYSATTGLYPSTKTLPFQVKTQADQYRVEYNPLEKLLYILRMPTTIHESYLEQMSDKTKASLKRIRSGNNKAAGFVAQISSIRSRSIRLQEFDSNNDTKVNQSYILQEPDDQFQHKEAKYPRMV